MTWAAIFPALLVGAAILFVPGVLVGFSLRLRGFRLIAFSPAISVSLVAVSAVVAPIVGIRWGLLPVVMLTVVSTAAGWAWAKFVGTRTGQPKTARRDSIPLAIAIVIPAVILSFILVRSMHDPAYFSQRYDNFFHLNAVQYVIDTGNASPFWVGSMTSPKGVPFYPSAWHAIAALVVTQSDASVAVAANAMIFIIAAVVWPIGAVFLARTILGRGKALTIVAGVLCAAFPAFPLLPLHYGVLYPLFLGLALSPVLLAGVWMILYPGIVRRRLDWGLLILLAIPGVSIAHPGALMAVIALSVPAVIGRIVVAFKRADRAGARVVPLIFLIAYVVVGVVILRVVRPPGSQIYWPVIEKVPSAVGEIVSASVYLYPPSFAISALLIVGTYGVVRRGGFIRWAVLATAVIGSALYVVVASSPYEILRYWLTAPWYNNAPRLASIWVISVLPLAALGGQVFVRWVLRVVPRVRPLARPVLVSVAVVGVGALIGLTQGPAMRQAAADVEFTYELRPGGPIISPDELAVMNDIDKLVPKDAVIAGDPWTGASFAYGVSGRRVLMPHLLMDLTPDAKTINTELATGGDSAKVCSALRATNVKFVLDFSADGDFQENHDDYSGLEGLDNSPYVRLIDRHGDAKLYKIESCGLG
ncbi:DUF6541 family protein [Microbacterium sp.]|uniref:DUF6541 family protein n=1 Tax=Microbacterium sp. TaxID=51671 RepID=UPI003C7143BA